MSKCSKIKKKLLAIGKAAKSYFFRGPTTKREGGVKARPLRKKIEIIHVLLKLCCHLVKS